MHNEVLSNRMVERLPLIKLFKREYYLVGGTAIALQIGHRRSIDFDLFHQEIVKPQQIKNRIEREGYGIEKIIYRSNEEFTCIIHGVKLTFFNYPFDIPHPIEFQPWITMPNLLDLATMKAYALSRRSKWKDYVDLYYLLKDHHSLKEIAKRASELFGDLFIELQFRQQLCYFDDIDYDEDIDSLAGNISEEEIRNWLSEAAFHDL